MVYTQPYIPEECPFCGEKSPNYSADIVASALVMSDGNGGISGLETFVNDDRNEFIDLRCEECDAALIEDGEAKVDSI